MPGKDHIFDMMLRENLEYEECVLLVIPSWRGTRDCLTRRRGLVRSDVDELPFPSTGGDCCSNSSLSKIIFIKCNKYLGYSPRHQAQDAKNKAKRSNNTTTSLFNAMHPSPYSFIIDRSERTHSHKTPASHTTFPPFRIHSRNRPRSRIHSRCNSHATSQCLRTLISSSIPRR